MDFSDLKCWHLSSHFWRLEVPGQDADRLGSWLSASCFIAIYFTGEKEGKIKGEKRR